jgi:hypothetical protein
MLLSRLESRNPRWDSEQAIGDENGKGTSFMAKILLCSYSTLGYISSHGWRRGQTCLHKFYLLGYYLDS